MRRISFSSTPSAAAASCTVAKNSSAVTRLEQDDCTSAPPGATSPTADLVRRAYARNAFGTSARRCANDGPAATTPRRWATGALGALAVATTATAARRHSRPYKGEAK